MNEQIRIAPPVTSGEQYFVARDDGHVRRLQWTDRIRDYKRWSVGNVFRNEDAAQAFVDYLKAIEVVRHDEGFMKHDFQGSGYCMRLQYVDADKVIFDRVVYVRILRYAGAFFFDTEEHAKQSIEKHYAEWQTIFDYEWEK